LLQALLQELGSLRREQAEQREAVGALATSLGEAREARAAVDRVGEELSQVAQASDAKVDRPRGAREQDSGTPILRRL